MYSVYRFMKLAERLSDTGYGNKEYREQKCFHFVLADVRQ
jgi:hypothetical protein